MKPPIRWPARHHAPLRPSIPSKPLHPLLRPFSSTPPRPNWLMPKRGHKDKNPKGRPHVATGGSTRGTNVEWGFWGLRMRDHDRRLSAKHLQLGLDTIKRKLRGQRYRIMARVCANIGVYTKSKGMRMGKGKGKFDYWAARVGVNRILYEVQGDLHEELVRDAFRLAGNKLPGLYEFAKRGDPPIVGMTKMENGLSREALLKPTKVQLPPPSVTVSAGRMPATSPP